MATITQYITALRQSIRDLKRHRDNDVLKIANDYLALAKRRVINEGKDGNNQSLGTYSKAVVPYWYYFGKETRRNNETAVNDLLQLYGYHASYEDWRRVNNLQVGFKDFSFTGRMWQSLQAGVAGSGIFTTKIRYFAETSAEQAKLNFAINSYPDLLKPTPQETLILQAWNEQRVLKRLKFLK